MVLLPCLPLPQHLLHDVLIAGQSVDGEDVEPAEHQHAQTGPHRQLASVASNQHVSPSCLSAKQPEHAPHTDTVKAEWNLVVCYPVVCVKLVSENPCFCWWGSDGEKQKRLTLQQLTLGCGVVVQCVGLCRNPPLCSRCITTIITTA
ncbi:hypothetical protein F7725_021604 [Dissostichus mawsoni]|uniref:Uncharacterized protein n=1 Tax=Dissostichus mawsoni TaxID=36200 RepID=A0A7J5ZBN6_DISMA|nr:hypothetical protein F7725_021604 [Dissostichus mawsoni]